MFLMFLNVVDQSIPNLCKIKLANLSMLLGMGIGVAKLSNYE